MYNKLTNNMQNMDTKPEKQFSHITNLEKDTKYPNNMVKIIVPIYY